MEGLSELGGNMASNVSSMLIGCHDSARDGDWLPAVRPEVTVLYLGPKNHSLTSSIVDVEVVLR